MNGVRSLPQRDLITIVASLVGVTALCWIYLVDMAIDMGAMMDMSMMQIPDWTADYFWMMFTMWSVMMVGMMLPSVAPMVLIYATAARKAKDQGAPIASTGVFTVGYLIIWVVFSFLATLSQWGLDEAALLSPMMVSNSPWMGAGLLIVAGIYQWLPVKDACLKQCRSPFQFISGHWRTGTFGALRMGLSHGAFCLGCCWLIMLLLFVGGVMNIVWIAAITIFVLLEKVLPIGATGGKWMGAVMIVAGALFFFV